MKKESITTRWVNKIPSPTSGSKVFSIGGRDHKASTHLRAVFSYSEKIKRMFIEETEDIK